MIIVAKVKCSCGAWVRIRATKVPTDEVQCWKCSTWIQINFVRRSGGTAILTKGSSVLRTSNIDVESLED